MAIDSTKRFAVSRLFRLLKVSSDILTSLFFEIVKELYRMRLWGGDRLGYEAQAKLGFGIRFEIDRNHHQFYNCVKSIIELYSAAEPRIDKFQMKVES